MANVQLVHKVIQRCTQVKEEVTEDEGKFVGHRRLRGNAVLKCSVVASHGKGVDNGPATGREPLKVAQVILGSIVLPIHISEVPGHSLHPMPCPL